MYSFHLQNFSSHRYLSFPLFLKKELFIKRVTMMANNSSSNIYKIGTCLNQVDRNTPFSISFSYFGLDSFLLDLLHSLTRHCPQLFTWAATETYDWLTGYNMPQTREKSKSKSKSRERKGECFLCGRPSTTKCPSCDLVFYCSNDHLLAHRHQNYCFPFR